MKRVSLAVAVLVAMSGLAACTTPPAPEPEPEPSVPWVKVLYLHPTDRPFRSDYQAAANDAVNQVQAWFRTQLGGETFVRASNSVTPCALPNNADYYRTNTWSRVVADVQACAPVAGYGSEVTWVLYVDVLDECGPNRIGAAQPGLAILPQGDLQGLVGEPQVDRCGVVENRPATRWVGGLGHEMGHAFGVPHPPGCDQGLPECDANSIMWTGFASYPATYLSASERSQMVASPFVR